MCQIILASASPRRKELLEQIGVTFTIIPSKQEEVITSKEPTEIVKELSLQKAMEVAEVITKGKESPHEIVSIIIGADTIVAYGNRIMGKPKNENEAKEMLTLLQGNMHQVYTGVTVVIDKKFVTFCEKTDVVMYPMSDQQVNEYIKSREPMDKAGAYAIQGKCAMYVKEIHGDYNNVVGLPIARLCQEIEKLGYSIA
ncbi:MAG TPA: Maf family protein [Lachnospiraceae bacterium]|nr:Maf family protein [Lachnospiraceae bacterium]